MPFFLMKVYKKNYDQYNMNTRRKKKDKYNTNTVKAIFHPKPP